MRRLLIAGVLGVVLIPLAACGDSSTSSKPSNLSSRRPTTGPSIRSRKTFHKATTLQDIDLMMSLWAPHATLSIGSGRPFRDGRDPASVPRGNASCSSPRLT